METYIMLNVYEDLSKHVVLLPVMEHAVNNNNNNNNKNYWATQPTYVLGLTFHSPQTEGLANIICLKWTHDMEVLSACQSVRPPVYVCLIFKLHLGSTLKIISKFNFGL